MQKLFGRSINLIANSSKATSLSRSAFPAAYACNGLAKLHWSERGLIQAPRCYFSEDNTNKNDNNSKDDSYAELPRVRPKTIPLKPYKASADGEKDKPGTQSYILFTSSNPVVPFRSQNGVIKTGNLSADHMQHEILYILQPEGEGQIYTVGVVLKNEVTKKLRSEITSEEKKHSTNTDDIYSGSDPDSSKAVISTKSKNFRVQLIEIEYRDNCIFAKGIPYKDKKTTKASKKVNLEAEVATIKNLCHSIHYSLQVKYVEAFASIDFDNYIEDPINPEKLEELLYIIVGEMGKVNSFMKENYQEFFQIYLEQRSPLVRLFMVKKKLEELQNVLDIAGKSMKEAEDSIRKIHEVAKARLSIEYIKNNFLGGMQSSQSQGGMGGAFGMPGQSSGSSKAKTFMDKLHLINDEASREKVRKEIERFSSMDKQSSEYQKIYTYLDEVFSIPWNERSEEVWDLEHSRKVLEEELYGLERVKERIVELIAVNKLRRSQEGYKKKGFVLCLYGPPGTGKTSIAKAISKSLKRESRFISFAGVNDSHFIKGHRRTYVDSQPGVFIRELIKAKTMNPVLVLDEIDKIGRSAAGGDPYYSLMEILNPEENSNFTDHYLDIKVDFSEVIFILTANQIINMLEPLRNRLEIIDIAPYIEQEKLTIAKNYLLPKVLKEHGLARESIKFDDQIISNIIKGWCYYEGGVRELNRCFEKICRKWAYELVDNLKLTAKVVQVEETKESASLPDGHITQDAVPPADIAEESETTSDVKDKPRNDAGEEQTTDSEKQSHQRIECEPVAVEEDKKLQQARTENVLTFTQQDDDSSSKLQKYLGLPVFDEVYERHNRKAYNGVVNILTVSGFSGHVLTVEVMHDITQTDKKGQFIMTGNLKQVLQESSSIARQNALRFLPKDKYEEAVGRNYHIHFLQGGTPKDGPSAGISITTALLSLILEKPVPSNLAMTGEVSLNGDVYKIGGVQAKLTAAKSLNINTVLVPYGNKTEFVELPQQLKKDLTVYFVKTYKEVYEICFGHDAVAIERIDRFDGTEGDEVQDAKDNQVQQSERPSEERKDFPVV